MSLRIAILGTRGIPNEYGGFEQLAEYLSVGFVAKGHSVLTYSSHNHSFKESSWKGVQIIHCYDAEKRMGTIGQFIYDFNCIRDARERNFDIILILGYTSISIWGQFFPGKSKIIMNMDGLEWKRTKYSQATRKFLLYAEKLGVKYSDCLVADSLAIQSYLKKKYDVESKFIAYGAEVFDDPAEADLVDFSVKKYNYFLIIARMEPENNIETIIQGFLQSNTERQLLIIGNTKNKFGTYLMNRYNGDDRLRFLGPIFNAKKIHMLKFFSFLYFHGHSVGGTNPSLLEAMASQALLAAHDNPFNRAILQNDAFYFTNPADVKRLVETVNRTETELQMIGSNLTKIKSEYRWDQIIDKYEEYIYECLAKKRS